MMFLCARNAGVWPRTAWLALLVGVAGAPRANTDPSQDNPPGQEQPDPDQKAASRRVRLKIDVEEQVRKLLAEKAKSGPPRFEDSVEVVAKSPQVMLERFFGGVDLECGPAVGGAPTEVEMRAVRPRPAPYVDLMPLAQLLAGKIKGKGPDRYYLYRLRRADGDVSYSLRERRVPESLLYNSPGISFELLETFSNLGEGARSLKRVERGGSPVPTDSASPMPPWVTTPCRPSKGR